MTTTITQEKIAVLGSGFSSLAASCYLAQAGHQVTIFEKNSTVGGRARRLERDGFVFDIGPTWYWTPDVFERFFNDFGKKVSDYYQLDLLDPAYRVYFGDNDYIDIGLGVDNIAATFEEIEPGSGDKLVKFINNAKDNYRIAIENLVYRPGESVLELVTLETAKKLGAFFSTISTDVRKEFKNPKLRSILEFPVLFLGAKPSDTPGFYSFMNYADFGLGTWNPKGGMYEVILGMKRLAEELGVVIHTDSPVDKILVDNNYASGIITKGQKHLFDTIVSGADYAHTETLLPQQYRQYSEQYWEKRTFAPSSLLFYVAFDKKIDRVHHHNLFFDVPFEEHAREIYDDPQWPTNPLFYVRFQSKSEGFFAPEGKEAATFLIPLAVDVEDNDSLREQYYNKVMDRFEQVTGQEVKSHVLFKEFFCVNDFKSEYNSYKGNAYGLANTLLQTAVLRPNLRSRKVKGLYFTGQLTVPGPGVPPSLISGKLTAGLVQKQFATT